MAEFQARVSGEVLFYFEELKKLYGKEAEERDITKSQILTRAFRETRGISNWIPIIEDTTSIPLNKMKYEKSTSIKAELSEHTDKGIRDLKYILPSFTDTRSVTIGVTLKFLLKGALILNKTGQVASMDELETIDYEFESLENNLKNLVAPINHEILSNMLSDFKNKLK